MSERMNPSLLLENDTLREEVRRLRQALTRVTIVIMDDNALGDADIAKLEARGFVVLRKRAGTAIHIQEFHYTRADEVPHDAAE